MQRVRAHVRSIVWALIGLIVCGLFGLMSSCISTAAYCNPVITTLDHISTPLRALPGALFPLALFFTYLADPEVILIIALASLIIFVIFHERYIAALCLMGLIIGSTSSLLLKNVFLRNRPADFLYVLPRIGSAFPSGHALISIIFYGFIGYCFVESTSRMSYKWLISICTVILILLIGLSRIILGYHWPSDVVGGWVLGFGILCFLIAGYNFKHVEWLKEKFPHGLWLFIVLILIIAVGFWIMTFYVTHPLVLRSMIMS